MTSTVSFRITFLQAMIFGVNDSNIVIVKIVENKDHLGSATGSRYVAGASSHGSGLVYYKNTKPLL
jgi:hypothetical protein